MKKIIIYSKLLTKNSIYTNLVLLIDLNSIYFIGNISTNHK